MLIKRFGRPSRVVPLVLLVLIIGSYCVGLGEAKRQRNFLVIANESSFSLRTLDKGLDAPLELRQIGPLRATDQDIHPSATPAATLFLSPTPEQSPTPTPTPILKAIPIATPPPNLTPSPSSHATQAPHPTHRRRHR